MSSLPLIVFDVNETLLDLTTLEPTFEDRLRLRLALNRWLTFYVEFGRGNRRASLDA